MKKIIIIPIFLIALLFNSCEDILDKQPLDIISDATVWSDKVLTDNYLNQCYAEMKFYFEQAYDVEQTSSTADRTSLHRAITIGDEVTLRFPTSGWSKKTKDITISGGIFEWWGYSTVRRLNVFIENTTSGTDGPWDNRDTYEVTLLSFTGKLLEQSLHNGNSFQLDLNVYPAGIFFLRIKQDGNVYTKKIVKK